MVRYLIQHPWRSELRPITREAWLAHFRDARLYPVGTARLVTYDPSGAAPQRYGVIEFDLPDDADEYRRYVGE